MLLRIGYQVSGSSVEARVLLKGCTVNISDGEHLGWEDLEWKHIEEGTAQERKAVLVPWETAAIR
ncbi:hypothetical protein [Aureliella helgolandensis]|uniref:hypothetical protein n=1 Tax=Aureliella helgolandensis TaxID=2527968 RepID=UPI0011A0CA11|nr:hypothetical protein [Aureliella helgolandensis]